MIWLAMQQTGVESRQSVVKIGDSAIDIEEGRNAECGMTFGVTTGAQTELQLRSAEPTHIVDSLGEMCDLVIAATK
jgi:phosphoglycolate phosphatase-like HAD superfamily hydrolase